jgi:hypothetical protein
MQPRRSHNGYSDMPICKENECTVTPGSTFSNLEKELQDIIETTRAAGLWQ